MKQLTQYITKLHYKFIERILFAFFTFSLILQVGPHFWLPFSYVSGIRVDYLVPTLYFSDIFLIILFLITLKDKEIKKGYKSVIQNNSVHIFFGIIIISTFIADSPYASLYGIIKLLEFMFLSIYVASKNIFQNKYFWGALALGVLISTSLATWQFLIQKSVGGVFYFMGERLFTVSTINIATMQINAQQLLRPYATFPHPNVLAYYLYISCSLLLAKMTQKSHSNIILLVLCFGSFGLLITGARVVSILYIVFIYFMLFSKFKIYHKKIVAWATLITIGFFLMVFQQRFFNATFLYTDWSYRVELNKIAWEIFSEKFMFGIGLNNFFIHEIQFQKTISPTLLQPVHNIYLLMLVQIGIIGGFIIGKFIYKIYMNAWKNYKYSDHSKKTINMVVFFLYISTIVIGFFDHFLITLQQGELLTAIVIGLAWKSRE